MIVKHKYDSLINIIHYLATWRLPRTISYSYPRVAAIRIDVDSAEENRSTQHVRFPRQSRYARHTLSVGSPSVNGNLSRVIDRFGRNPLLPRKKWLLTQSIAHHWLICGSVPSFSPKSTNEAVDLSQASVADKLLGLLGPYHQYAIDTFNTCSRGPTHRSLTDTDGGYNLGGTGFPHTTPRPSQPIISPFHLRALLDLRLSINSLPSELKGDQTLNLTSGSLHSTFTVTYHLSIARANNVPPRSG
jgi:hypothetical protein